MSANSGRCDPKSWSTVECCFMLFLDLRGNFRDAKSNLKQILHRHHSIDSPGDQAQWGRTWSLENCRWHTATCTNRTRLAGQGIESYLHYVKVGALVVNQPSMFHLDWLWPTVWCQRYLDLPLKEIVWPYHSQIQPVYNCTSTILFYAF